MIALSLIALAYFCLRLNMATIAAWPTTADKVRKKVTFWGMQICALLAAVAIAVEVLR